MRIAAHPGLYDPADEAPLLAGSCCNVCGRVAFPPVAIGCDLCGAGEASLEPIELEASGILHSFATVHVRHGDLEAPFTIGEVQLKAGPLIRATMAPDQANLAIGQQVSAVWRIARVDADVVEVVEPVFVAVER